METDVEKSNCERLSSRTIWGIALSGWSVKHLFFPTLVSDIYVLFCIRYKMLWKAQVYTVKSVCLPLVFLCILSLPAQFCAFSLPPAVTSTMLNDLD